MRLVVGTLAVLLSSSLASAEDAGPVRVESVESRLEDASARTRTKVPVRVVRIMRETNQALLFDRTAGGTYLLVGVGEKIAGYTVEAIDEDEVTLSLNDRQIVLAAPDQSWRRRRGGRGDDAREVARPTRGEPAVTVAPGVAPAVVAVAPAPADPYGAAADEKAPIDPYGKPERKAPVDPYADAEEIREAKAPSWIEPAPEAVRSTSAAGPGTPVPVPVVTVIAPSTPSPSVTPPSSSVTPPSVPAVAPAPMAPTMIGPAPAPAADPVLARRDVDAALADFGALAAAFRASFTPTGVKVDSIADGSLFAKAGLRAGDLIASVDGRPLRSLDDVAALYARAQALRVVTAQVVRGGKPLALRVTIQ